MSPFGRSAFTSLRDRLPPGLRRRLGGLATAGLDVVRPWPASRLATGKRVPARATLAEFESLLAGVADVRVVRVEEPAPPIRSPRGTEVPPHRPIDNAYVCLDTASPEVTLRDNHVIGPGRMVLTESRAPFAELKIGFTRLEPVEDRPGTTAYLSNIWVDNYYHWLAFVLPNLRLMAEELGVRPDHVYVGRPLKRWHLETLAAFGFGPEQVLAEGTRSERTVAVFPDRAGALDGRAIDFVRGALRPKGGPPPHRRLYVGRGRTRHRRLLNADACEAMLREEHGFEVVTMEGRTVAEQAELFAGATTIVAPHGAALTNLMFASPGAKVVELVPHDADDAVFSYFAELCAHVGCTYARVRGEPLATAADRANLQDLYVDVGKLDRTVSALLAEG